MLRVSLLTQNRHHVVLKIEGWLSGAYVELLQDALNHWSAQAAHITLDLGQVRTVDRTGVQLLNNWRKAGVTLEGGSVYIRALLGESPLRHQPPGSKLTREDLP